MRTLQCTQSHRTSKTRRDRDCRLNQLIMKLDRVRLQHCVAASALAPMTSTPCWRDDGATRILYTYQTRSNTNTKTKLDIYLVKVLTVSTMMIDDGKTATGPRRHLTTDLGSSFFPRFPRGCEPTISGSQECEPGSHGSHPSSHGSHPGSHGSHPGSHGSQLGSQTRTRVFQRNKHAKLTLTRPCCCSTCCQW